MADNKCDYIVSNTIEISEEFKFIILHDLHKRQGRYTYLYPSSIKIASFAIGVVTESVATMSN